MSRSTPSFEEDMRLIREKRDISRETLHARTKIALENIELFEQGELGQHPHFNDVYVRALVRAYAGVLDISTERALQSLEKARAGTYDGELGDVYLDREADTREGAFDTEETTESVEESPDSLEESGRSGRGDASDSLEQPASPITGEEKSGNVTPEPETGESHTPRAAGTVGEQSHGVAAQRSAGSRSSRRAVNEWFATGGASTIILGGAAVILIALAVWAFTALFSGSASQPADEADPSEAADTTAESTEVVEERPPVAVIGDSLDFTIIAANNRLEPIRVRLDGGAWNPYWVEQGDSISFVASNAFTIRDYLSRAHLRVETLDWPLNGLGRYDTVRVSRQLVQERIDSLSAARVP